MPLPAVGWRSLRGLLTLLLLTFPASHALCKLPLRASLDASLPYVVSLLTAA